MNILVTTQGNIVYYGDQIAFGPWEEQDKLNGITICKWKFLDSNNNLLCYAIDENMDAMLGLAQPTATVVSIPVLPENFIPEMYLYRDGRLIPNPDYVSPPKTVEELSLENSQLKTQLEEMSEVVDYLVMNSTMMGGGL